jgi:hypothetical protein
MQGDAKIVLPANMDRQQYPRTDFDNLLLGVLDSRSELVNWAAVSGSKTTQSLSSTDQALLWDLILFGDGGAFVDRIVTPVFRHVTISGLLQVRGYQAALEKCADVPKPIE